jgi:hypothetical protein
VPSAHTLPHHTQHPIHASTCEFRVPDDRYHKRRVPIRFLCRRLALERRDGSILARGRVSTKPRNLPSRYLACHPTHLARIEIISPHATAHALAVEVGLQNDSRCLPGRQGSRLLVQDSMRMGLCRVCAASTGCARCEHRFPRSVAPRQLRRLMRYAPPPGPHPVRGAPTAWCQSRPGLAA